jgi:hypothetical protein
MTDIPDHTRVGLQVQQADTKLPDASADGGMYAKRVGGGALAGAGMGALIGLSMGLTCGPAVVLCAPIGAIGGLMGGTVFGIGMGTFSAASLQLPQEKAEQFDVVIARTLEELNLSDEVSMSFQRAGDSKWSFVDEEAEVEIQIDLEGIGLQKHKKDHVTISMATSLVVQRGSGETATIEKRSFETTSVPEHIDYWIDGDGDNFREQLQHQAAQHAQDMYVELYAQNWDSIESEAPTGFVLVDGRNEVKLGEVEK